MISIVWEKPITFVKKPDVIHSNKIKTKKQVAINESLMHDIEKTNVWQQTIQYIGGRRILKSIKAGRETE